MVMASNLNDARFLFMRTADRYYMNRLRHYSSLNRDKVPELMMMHMPPPEPLPLQTFVPDGRLLVPEDQFLAQHPGSSLISVICVPDGGPVIKITVESLSINLASLKEQIARMVQIPPSKQVLSSTAGDLKDIKRSLAYYNVGPGALLIMKVVRD
ncbi:putative splicing factor 3A subunit 1 [Cardamine amara subsp. amara]|uniref:Splicing factor 3A subunit 1 n=1 Tax=Cardamine amara subsp. amara TaxID=228776 RepID=A0ABD0ZPT9_CARAN